MRARAAALGLALALAPGCRCNRDHGPAPAASVAQSKAKRQRGVGLAPLQAGAPRASLPVDGFGAAEVDVPIGATDSRPVVIALEAGDPATLCDKWRAVTTYGFVLCPQGVQTEPGLRAALKALRARYGDYISPGPVVLAGFARGADLAAQIAREEPSYFARLVLVAGGASGWSSGIATIYARGGGKRVLFVCDDDGCTKDATAAVVLTEHADARAKLASATGDAMQAIAGAWSWLVEDDPSWRPPPAKPP